MADDSIDGESTSATVVACPHCGQRNRLVRRDGDAKYRCGACKTEIGPSPKDGRFTVLTDGRTFCGTQEEVLEALGNGKLSGNDVIHLATADGGVEWVALRDWVLRCGLVVPAPPAQRNKMRRKSVVLAFMLVLFSGPIGFFYINWRHGLSAIGMCAAFVAAMAGPRQAKELLATAAGYRVWLYLQAIVCGVVAAVIVDDRNSQIPRDDGDVSQWDDTCMATAAANAFGAFQLVIAVFFGLGLTISAAQLVWEGRFLLALAAVPVFGLSSVWTELKFLFFSGLLVAIYLLAKHLYRKVVTEPRALRGNMA